MKFTQPVFKEYMKRFLIFLTIAITCLSLLAASAEAKRLGGGSSIGKQRTITPPPTAAPAPNAAPAPVGAPAPSGNRWMGPLAGLAIGAGLGALFAGGGLSGGMGGILMALVAVAIVMFLLSLLRSKQPMRYAASQPPYGNSAPVHQPAMNSGAYAGSVRNIPAGFPVDDFLRSAKISFIRLQAANDSKDLNDIREYTSPEMFAEISMQLQERDGTPQRTTVMSLSGDLLQVVTENDLAIASVRFTGQLSENNGTPENVDEIWHVQKNLLDDHSAWLLAGIQQTTFH